MLKFARIINDRDCADRMDTPHVAEALQHRRREGDWTQEREQRAVSVRS
ncbi:MAG: hypothetical protein JW846_04275 [Dehalococcoidia bacterium]|nr:hypothetical protein [Dehalococcoidia bacterium]